MLYGAPGRIRTSDRSVRSRVLYPAELQAHNVKGVHYGEKQPQGQSHSCKMRKIITALDKRAICPICIYTLIIIINVTIIQLFIHNMLNKLQKIVSPNPMGGRLNWI